MYTLLPSLGQHEAEWDDCALPVLLPPPPPRRKEAMAVLTGLSVLAGAGPVYFLINADLQARGFAASLAMSALAGALVSIAGERAGSPAVLQGLCCELQPLSAVGCCCVKRWHYLLGNCTAERKRKCVSVCVSVCV